MESGVLRHRVTLQTATASKDAYGGPTQTFANTKTVWASVRPLSGREFQDAQRTSQEVSHEVVIRYDSDLTVTPRMRAIHNSRTFEVVSVTNVDERNRTLVLNCREVV